MPYLSVQIIKGATREKKHSLLCLLPTLLTVLGMKPEHTHIVIQEMA
jgi:4-oxalocrotonate tautomerase